MLAFGFLQLMRLGRVGAMFAISAAVTFPATGALAGSERLTAEAISELMLGKRMIGVRVDTGESWFECVAGSGDTIYSIEGRISTGFVEVASDGETCFTYPSADDTRKTCFSVVLERGSAVFVERVTGVRFRVTHTDTDFDGCSEAAPGS